MLSHAMVGAAWRKLAKRMAKQCVLVQSVQGIRLLIDGACLDLRFASDRAAVALFVNLHRDAPSLAGRWRSAATTSVKAAED